MTLDNKDAEQVSLLKCDAKGRVRRSLAQREEILAEFDRSGLSAPAFAKLIGVHYQTLVGWKKARAKQNSASLEVTVTVNTVWKGMTTFYQES